MPTGDPQELTIPPDRLPRLPRSHRSGDTHHAWLVMLGHTAIHALVTATRWHGDDVGNGALAVLRERASTPLTFALACSKHCYTASRSWPSQPAARLTPWPTCPASTRIGSTSNRCFPRRGKSPRHRDPFHLSVGHPFQRNPHPITYGEFSECASSPSTLYP
jgi:hypothetical protein